LLLEISPHQEIGSIIKYLKGRTSRELRKSHSWLTKLPSFWTRSAFVSSVGAVSLKVVKRYIQNQKS
jgi:putative transposase